MNNARLEPVNLPASLRSLSARSRLVSAGWRACRTTALALVMGVVTVVAGCSGTSPTGVGGQGTGASAAGEQYGSVSGLGSVIVEGALYEESTSTVRQLELDPASPQTITSTALRLGMQSRLAFDTRLVATSVLIQPTLLGAIERQQTDLIVVAGQTVRLSTVLPVVLDGLTDLGDLAVGDRVEVHGYLDSNREIVATRIQRLDPAAAVQTRVTGIISAVTSGTRVTVGDLTLELSAGTTTLPAGATPAPGQRIVAWAAAAPSGGRLTPKTVALNTAITGTDLLRAGGLVRGFDRAGGRFQVGALVVDFSGTVAYTNGTATDLADGRIVRIRGQASAGILRANEIAFIKASEDALGELTGTISDFASLSSFKVRAAAIDASASAVIFRNGTAGNLANGALVKIEGRLVGGRLLASRVEFITTEDARALSFRGSVSDYSATSGAFKLLGVSMKLDGNARLSTDGGAILPRGSFSNGDIATVTGSFSSGTFVVTAAQIIRDGVEPTRNAEGIAYAVSLVQQTLKLNGIVVRWSASTRIDGSLNDLQAGVPIRVEGTIISGELVASRLTLRP